MKLSKNHKLTFDNVSKSFYRKDNNSITHALSNVSFEAKNEEFISLVGPSGSGKSTILRLIAGLIGPTMGSVSLDGKKVEGPSQERGMVFQSATLFPWLTVRENVGFGPKGKVEKETLKKRVDELVKMAGLESFKDSYPHELSGGMAQRVALIRTMINNPPVFLLDEPFGALDAFTRMNMQDELLDMWNDSKNTMIMVTHDIDEAIYMSTRVITLSPNPGRIKENLKIDLPYPRNRSSDEFIDYRKYIYKVLDFGK